MRATPKRFIKTLFFTSLMCFIIVNINLFLRSQPSSEELDTYGQEPLLHSKPSLQQNSSTTNKSAAIKQNPDKGQIVLPAFNNTQVTNVSSRLLLPPVANLSRETVKFLIRKANRDQRILNLDKFELAASGESTIVVVVQVHNRQDYLLHLVDSLRRARDIEQILLIFSHDFLDDNINQLIANIDFCPVMQIFYPFLIQYHQNEFPGESPGDCPRNVNKEEAMKLGCTNAEYPDKYGHYREAKYTQTKHHWFWKLNHVFDHLSVTSSFDGPVLLIEEDHFLVEDFIPVLRKMYRLREKSCADCSIFTLGTYDKRPAYGPLSSRGGGVLSWLFGSDKKDDVRNILGVDLTNWVSSKHNMGMSFNREVWKKIKACAKPFCDFDDYNWDWSLHFIGMGCIPNKLKVMVAKSPRIYHIGECGVHHKGKNCDSVEKVKQIRTSLDQNKRWLFPEALAVGGTPRAPSRMPKPNGGWGDRRDHEMCASFLESDTHR